MSALARQSTRPISRGGGRQGGDLSVPIAVASAVVAAGVSYVFRRPRHIDDTKKLDKILDLLNKKNDDEDMNKQKNDQRSATSNSEGNMKTSGRTRRTSDMPTKRVIVEKQLEGVAYQHQHRGEVFITGGGVQLLSNIDGGKGARSLLSSTTITTGAPSSQRSLAESHRYTGLETVDNLSITANSNGEKEAYVRKEALKASPTSAVATRRERNREKEVRMRLLLQRAHSKTLLLDDDEVQH